MIDIYQNLILNNKKIYLDIFSNDGASCAP